MEMNKTIFDGLETVNNHSNLRVYNDELLVKRAEMNHSRIRELCKKRIEGEPLPIDYKMEDNNSCYYIMKRIDGIDYQNVKVNDKAFSALLDNGFKLLKEYHDHKIFLCDIKESNIMFDGKVHFVDFDDVCAGIYYPRFIYQDSFLVFGKHTYKRDRGDLIQNDKLGLLHVMLRIASNAMEDHLMDHDEYDLSMLSPELRDAFNAYIFGKEKIDREDYLDKEVRALKKELRIS